jgi:hypothetical protein
MLAPMGVFVKAQSLELAFFSSMVGKWESTYKVEDLTDKEQMDNHFILHKNYLEMNIHGSSDKYPEAPYEERYIYTLDENYKIIGWYFSDNRDYIGTTLTGKVDGGILTVEAKGKSTTWKFTYELTDDNKITRTATGTDKNGPYKIVAVFMKMEK